MYAAVYGNFPMAGPWAGSGIPNQASKISPVKKIILIVTTKSKMALYDQLLFSPCVFRALLLRFLTVSGSNIISVQNNHGSKSPYLKQAKQALVQKQPFEEVLEVPTYLQCLF